MRQHQEPPRLRRQAEQRRYLALVLYGKAQLFDHCHFAAILAEPASLAASAGAFLPAPMAFGWEVKTEIPA
jgi:hypothetical protein